MADPKQARELIAEFPEDSLKALEEITFWFDSLSRTENFKLNYRYELYETLDNAARIHQRKLSQDYLSSDRIVATNDRLTQMGISFSAAYVTEYPTFMLAGNPPQYCEKMLSAFQHGYEIDAGEARWAHEVALNSLNNALREGVNRIHALTGNPRWLFVDGITGSLSNQFDPHGMCALAPYDPTVTRARHPVTDRTDNIRWFRTARDASHLELTTLERTSGLIHPNEFGHRAVSNRLLALMPPSQSGEELERTSGRDATN